MKIEKVLNNNVVVALDENGAETVLMGRGLGFGRREGDEAPPDKVEKRFTLHSDQLSDRFQQLITSIPLPHFLMSERIINHAKIALGKELSDSIYVTLPDHISAAVNRYKEGIVLPNPLLWDIRQLYKDEFRVGLKANEIVKEETGVEFTDDEAAFIALHFVNAQLGGEIRDIYDMTYLLQTNTVFVRTVNRSITTGSSRTSSSTRGVSSAEKATATRTAICLMWCGSSIRRRMPVRTRFARTSRGRKISTPDRMSCCISPSTSPV